TFASPTLPAATEAHLVRVSLQLRTVDHRCLRRARRLEDGLALRAALVQQHQVGSGGRRGQVPAEILEDRAGQVLHAANYHDRSATEQRWAGQLGEHA